MRVGQPLWLQQVPTACTPLHLVISQIRPEESLPRMRFGWHFGTGECDQGLVVGTQGGVRVSGQL